MGKDSKLVIAGLVIAALVIAGVVYASGSKNDPGTCELTDASLALIAAGLQKDHSTGEIISEAGAGFIATEACNRFVKIAVEKPGEAQKAEIKEGDGATSTQLMSGLELAKAEEAKHERIEAIIQRFGVCAVYKDGPQFQECLDGRINPP